MDWKRKIYLNRQSYNQCLLLIYYNTYRLATQAQMQGYRDKRWCTYSTILSLPLVDYFGDCMSNDYSCSLCFFFGYSRRDAHLERRLQLPSNILWCCVDWAGHALQPSNEDSICQSLPKRISTLCWNRSRAMGGELTSSTISCRRSS